MPQNHENLSAEIGALEPVHPRCIGAREEDTMEMGRGSSFQYIREFFTFLFERAGSERERTKKRPRARALLPHFSPDDTLFRDSCCCCWRMGNGSYLQKGVEEEEEEEEEENEQVYLSFARAQADTHSRRYRRRGGGGQ